MISTTEYKARRRQLALNLPSNSIAIIPSARELIRNGDVHYRFRQDSDFYYLSGFNEPEALLLISAGAQSKSILFNRARNLSAEQWSGKRLGQDDALAALGIDSAYPIEQIDKLLPQFLASMQNIYYTIGRHLHWEQRILELWRQIKKPQHRDTQAPKTIMNLAPIIGEMRLIKSTNEIQAMRHAAQISITAHQRAMQICSSAHYEYQLEAEILHEFNYNGCPSPAYGSIVAGGANACILHYTDNNHALCAGELVLIDAGCEFNNYAADISRTFPINGRFNPEQRLIYELVLHAQKAGIACIAPGRRWDEAQQAIIKVLSAGLIELGLLHGNLDDIIAQGAYKKFYMHNSGHWLGLDVHDSGTYKIDGAWRTLSPNMVLTVEPGLYISPNDSSIDKRWWGIGVRIEDDILVTEAGSESLSHDLIKETKDIEEFMRA